MSSNKRVVIYFFNYWSTDFIQTNIEPLAKAEIDNDKLKTVSFYPPATQISKVPYSVFNGIKTKEGTLYKLVIDDVKEINNYEEYGYDNAKIYPVFDGYIYSMSDLYILVLIEDIIKSEFKKDLLYLKSATLNFHNEL